MHKKYLADPRVREMVELAVWRNLRMFADYPDHDRESLVTDMMGEVARAKYKPRKSQPHTFAFRVASLRSIDIIRSRTIETKHLANAREIEGVKLSYVEADIVEEGTEAELAEAARRFYVSTKNYFDRGEVPLRRSGPGRPSLAPDRAQQAALFMLQSKMGWSCRMAARVMRQKPGILAAIGVAKSPSRGFFSRNSAAVTKFKKYFPAPKILSAC